MSTPLKRREHPDYMKGSGKKSGLGKKAGTSLDSQIAEATQMSNRRRIQKTFAPAPD